MSLRLFVAVMVFLLTNLEGSSLVGSQAKPVTAPSPGLRSLRIVVRDLESLIPLREHLNLYEREVMDVRVWQEELLEKLWNKISGNNNGIHSLAGDVLQKLGVNVRDSKRSLALNGVVGKKGYEKSRKEAPPPNLRVGTCDLFGRGSVGGGLCFFSTQWQRSCDPT